MIGTHLQFSTDQSVLSKKNTDCFNYLHEDSMKCKTIIASEVFELFLTYYDGYPHIIIDNKNVVVMIEGMIYNIQKIELENIINSIAKEFCNDNDYINSIKRFVTKADGDFIVTIYDKTAKNILLFNDSVGRLPLYYWYENTTIIVGRQIKFILDNIPNIEVNRYGLVEFLMLKYTLGDHTLFKGINTLGPAKILSINTHENRVIVDISNTTALNFDLVHPYKNKKESIDALKNCILKATKSRISTLKEWKYNITADISGGYDSRTVFGAIAKYYNEAKYNTYIYTNDEYKIAIELFNILDKPGTFDRIEMTDSILLKNIKKLVYVTDGLVDFKTTQGSYSMFKYCKQRVSGKTAHFMGFGGEYIRHPQTRFYKSLYNGFINGAYSFLSLEEACKIALVDINEYKAYLNNYFSAYNEKTVEGQLKHFYHEYYLHHVIWAGEDRARIHFWTVQPLMQFSLLEIIFNKTPLKWASYKFHLALLKNINPKLCTVPIHNSPFDITSNIEIRKYYMKLKTLTMLKNFKVGFLQEKFPKFINKINTRKNGSNTDSMIDKFDDLVKTNSVSKKLFDLIEAKKCIYKIGGDYSIFNTIILYFNQIEKRHKDKLDI